jgi:hypothetical protein
VPRISPCSILVYMAFYSALLDRKLSLNIILLPLLRAGHILRRMLQNPCFDTKEPGVRRRYLWVSL